MSTMLEEMAGRIKRESELRHGGEGPYFVGDVLCSTCSGTCDSHATCPHTAEDESAMLMARWAVWQVRAALLPQERAMSEAELKAIQDTTDDERWVKYDKARQAFIDAYWSLIADASCVEKCENDAELGVEKCEKKG